MEDYWWEVENMSMDDPLFTSSTPSPPSPYHLQPQPQIHPPPPPLPLSRSQPLPHLQNMGSKYEPIEQLDMTTQKYINPNFTNTTNINKTNVSTTASNNLFTVEEDNQQSRPLGSKNNTKSPILINNLNVNVMQSAILEIIHDTDVMECLKTYANKYQCGLTVMSGTGFVKDVTLRHGAGADEATLKLSGKHEILAIDGGFFPGPPSHMESGLRVFFADGHGQVIGGVVVGQLVVYGLVRVVAAYFTSTITESLPLPFLVSPPGQVLPQFPVHMQIKNIKTTSAASSSSSAPAPPPQPSEKFVGKPSMAETSSLPPLHQGYCGLAPPHPPPSSF